MCCRTLRIKNVLFGFISVMIDFIRTIEHLKVHCVQVKQLNFLFIVYT